MGQRGQEKRTNVVEDFRKFGDICHGFTIVVEKGCERDRGAQDEIRSLSTKQLQKQKKIGAITLGYDVTANSLSIGIFPTMGR